MAQTAFVTGGTGFIGINLVELLVNEGWDVTALHRSTSDLTYLKRFPIRLAEGSITDRESLGKAIPQGTDVVFHVAGDTNMWSRRNAQQAPRGARGSRGPRSRLESRGGQSGRRRWALRRQHLGKALLLVAGQRAACRVTRSDYYLPRAGRGGGAPCRCDQRAKRGALPPRQ